MDFSPAVDEPESDDFAVFAEDDSDDFSLLESEPDEDSALSALAAFWYESPLL